MISTQNIINIIILQSAHTPYYQKSPCHYISPAHTDTRISRLTT